MKTIARPLHKLMQGALCMCRRNQLVGCALAAIGIGALLSQIIGGGVLCAIIALALIGAGIVMAGKK